MRLKNIALYASDFNWSGGIDYIYFLYKGLSNTDSEYNFFIILDVPSKRSFAGKLYQLFKSLIKLILGRISGQFFASIIRDLFKKNQYNVFLKTPTINQYMEVFKGERVEFITYRKGAYSLDKMLKSKKIDIILPVLNPVFGKNYFIPHIGYIFDFTHRYNPSFYSADHYLQSDIKFAETLLKSDVLIVNSQSVKNDIKKFYPTNENIIFDLPFTPFINEQILKEATQIQDKILAHYKVDKPFFIICNQMWPHKNHEVAFRALALVKKEFKNTLIICTGSKTDLSGTEARYLELLDYSNALGLTEDILFLGHIDKVHQVALVNASVGLIQPTTFEGGPGGGSVYLALALNKSCLVSDISINREIVDFPNVTFFNPEDGQTLAQQMLNLLEQRTKSKETTSSFSSMYELRLKKLGKRLEEAILCAIETHRHK